MHDRFQADFDHERRVSLFPLVASFPQGETSEDIVWLGAPQIREPFAQTLFRTWAPLAKHQGTSATPVVVWHTTQGQGYCLMRMVSERGVWRISALLLSRSDVLTMRCDPFLLLYGNALPSPDASKLRPAVLSLGQLASRASQVLDYSFRPQEYQEATEHAQEWLKSLEEGDSKIKIEASGYRELFLSVVAAWPSLSLEKKLETNLVIAPPSEQIEGFLEPCITCSLVAPPSLVGKAMPIIERDPLESLEAQLNAPDLTPDPVSSDGRIPAELFSGVPLAVRARESFSNDAVKPEELPNLDLPEGGRSLSQEVRIDITARFLAEADSGVDLSRAAMMRRLQNQNMVSDVASYRHLLDCLVCGLEPRVERLPISFLLDLLLSYAPRTFGLEHEEAARMAFEEVIVDAARLARISGHPTIAAFWSEGILRHSEYESLMAQGFETALRGCLRGTSQDALSGLIRQITTGPGHSDVPDWRKRVEDFSLRLNRRTDEREAVEIFDLSGNFLRRRNTAERKKHIASKVKAIEDLAGKARSKKISLGDLNASAVDLESRLVEAWGLKNYRGASIAWQGRGGLGMDTLVGVLAVVDRFGKKRTRESGPLGVEISGPVGSVDRIKSRLDAVHNRRRVQPTDQFWSARGESDDTFERAGVAVRCTPLRNIWASVGKPHKTGGNNEAVMIAPREGITHWPKLLGKCAGVVMVVEVERLLQDVREVRRDLLEVVALWERYRAAKGGQGSLKMALVLTGLEEVEDPSYLPLEQALEDAFARISNSRSRGVNSSLLRDMSQLGDLARDVFDEGQLKKVLEGKGVDMATFVLPDAVDCLKYNLHDLPLMWLLEACGVRLNLDKGTRTSRLSGAMSSL